jgi:epoxyqueuosine reductase
VPAGRALVARLKEKAAALGLGHLGVAPVAPSDHADALRRWLDRGMAASMTWMERTAIDSVDLTRRFPWAKSALVAAVPHLPYDGARAAQAGVVPHLARYALGADYHLALRARLTSLMEFLGSEAPGTTNRVYVDTGPILERELAARAGLGWFGKSTNLILRGGDSYVLLGEILTSALLPPDEPSPDRCGSCTACIDDCPTGAILEPYVVDSQRCISYLTIEHRGRIPVGRERDLGEWIFGCDICQEVCPWNRKIAPAEDPAFITDPRFEHETLADVVRLDDAAFADRFAGTAVARARRQGMVRNAIIVAANTGDEPAIDAARGALEDADPIVRSTAAGALVRAGGAANRRRVERALAAERDTEVAADIEAALDGRRFDGPRDPVL